MAKGSNNPPSSSSKFAKHANEDAALAARRAGQEGEAAAAAATEARGKGLTTIGKISLFLGLPTLVGFAGLVMGYLASKEDPERKLAIEVDFAMPFMLTLTLVIVVGMQTQGYTKDKVEPILQWPKTKKQRKIIHKHVVKGQDPNSVPDEVDDIDEEPEKDDDAKKKD